MKSKHKLVMLFLLSLLTFLSLMPLRAIASDASSLENNPTGLGVIFGEPTGFTAKFWMPEHQAIDAGLAFSLSSYVLIYSDYLFHFPGVFGNSTEFTRAMSPYVGVGAEIIISENSVRTNNHYFDTPGSSTGLGIRIPLGIEWALKTMPIGIFAELVPGMGITPGTYGFFQGGVGARWYF